MHHLSGVAKAKQKMNAEKNHKRFSRYFLFYTGTFDYNPFFKYNYCRNLKEAIFMGKFIEEFYYGNLDPQARSTKENKVVQELRSWQTPFGR